MSLNFGQIPPLTTELAALERLKNRCHHVISVDIDPIFFKLAGNMDMHNIMNEFEFRPDRTTDYGVSCPWASKKYPYRPYNGENGVSTFSLLFLIESFWYFHVTRTRIKAWMSLNFLKWDLTLAHWTQVSDRCPLGYLLEFFLLLNYFGMVFWPYLWPYWVAVHARLKDPKLQDTKVPFVMTWLILLDDPSIKVPAEDSNN